MPAVFTPGSLYVTQVSLRRDSGTAYTTKELADEVVQYALEPLVYSPGPAEGAEPADWKLKSSAELLRLKVCDPAVGSGAILVAACRYLAYELGPQKIRVHAISPGPLKTRAASGLKDFELLLNEAVERAPLHQLVDIEDVGFACAYLAADFGRRITGGTIYIDGGANIIA